MYYRKVGRGRPVTHNEGLCINGRRGGGDPYHIMRACVLTGGGEVETVPHSEGLCINGRRGGGDPYHIVRACGLQEGGEGETRTT